MATDSELADDNASQASYTVVARRYRPRSFAELIGQDHIAQALGKAIATGRVGHAYLFTGARGVGKTSTARIFAKVLNLPEGTDEALVQEVSQAIDSGDDIDVIEIDGASNRGIEEIRQLRANVNVRPSRSPNKIYIIDEVHMLTNQAFNALLKTLEEPPPHVKFIFCTTDPDKIPITVLSRCQRFDFAPVGLEDIQSRLGEICQGEGYEADEEALALLARRAAGSMRDSQSLLEQVMSFSSDRISVEQVHALLGTADESRLQAIVEALIEKNPLQAMELVDESVRAGSDSGQLAEQLLNYFRDLMAAGVGGGADLLKLANPSGLETIRGLAERWGTQTILSAIQILDESLVRMRTSVSSTTLLEVALVQVCQLEQLTNIPELLNRLLLQPPAAQKKKLSPESASSDPRGSGQLQGVAEPPRVPNDPNGRSKDSSGQPAAPKSQASAAVGASSGTVPSPDASRPTERPTEQKPTAEDSSSQPVLASGDSLAIWQQALKTLDGMLADFAGLAAAVEPLSSDAWRIVFPQGASHPKEYCEQSDRKLQLQQVLGAHLGRQIQLQFHVIPGEAPKPAAVVPQAVLRQQKMKEISEDPYVKKLCEVIDGEIIRVDAPREAKRGPNGSLNGQGSPAS